MMPQLWLIYFTNFKNSSTQKAAKEKNHFEGGFVCVLCGWEKKENFCEEVLT
jgi:hypothetical protein